MAIDSESYEPKTNGCHQDLLSYKILGRVHKSLSVQKELANTRYVIPWSSYQIYQCTVQNTQRLAEIHKGLKGGIVQC